MTDERQFNSTIPPGRASASCRKYNGLRCSLNVLLIRSANVSITSATARNLPSGQMLALAHLPVRSLLDIVRSDKNHNLAHKADTYVLVTRRRRPVPFHDCLHPKLLNVGEEPRAF